MSAPSRFLCECHGCDKGEIVTGGERKDDVISDITSCKAFDVHNECSRLREEWLQEGEKTRARGWFRQKMIDSLQSIGSL